METDSTKNNENSSPCNLRSLKSKASFPTAGKSMTEIDQSDFPEQLFTQKQLRKMCGGISDMTIWRMRQNTILPEPVIINGRNYWKRSTLSDFFSHLSQKNRPVD